MSVMRTVEGPVILKGKEPRTWDSEWAAVMLSRGFSKVMLPTTMGGASGGGVGGVGAGAAEEEAGAGGGAGEGGGVRSQLERPGSAPVIMIARSRGEVIRWGR